MKNPKRRSIPVKIKREVMIRDNFTCQICGKKADFYLWNSKGIIACAKKNETQWRYWADKKDEPIKFEFDHIFPQIYGGSNNSKNIRLICRACNRRKNNRIEIDGEWISLPIKI